MKNLSNIMKEAHKIAKTLTGDYTARLSYALKAAWAKTKEIVIEKGNEYYKKAQELANTITYLANTERNNNTMFSINLEKLGGFIYSIAQTNTFAAKIATTVDNTINPYGYKVANVSSKQAWILACEAVKKNIKL